MKDQFTDHGIVVDNAIGFWIQRVYQATRGEMYRRFREHGGETPGAFRARSRSASSG